MSKETPPPKQIGPYTIGRELGAGGMGTVYYATDAESGEEVAVKVLPASLAREGGFVERFNREIAALQKLNNQYVVKLIGSGVENDVYYYAMEYVAGETLTARLLREKRIPWKEVIDFSLQICSALKSAHDAGIIHRDLKPSNLMLTEDGNVKLTDFGVAQIFAADKLTMTGGIIGTAEYMSPEQAEGRRATKKSDLYSLGAVMYVMLTGRPPFTGKTTLDIIQKHRFGRFDKPRMIVQSIPRWLEDIVCQLLNKNPDERYPDAYVLSLRLQEVVKKVELSSQDETVAVSQPGTAIGDTDSDGIVGGPGAGTLMQKFLKAEIESAQQGTPISNALNNIWVLLLLLAMVIGGGFWWFRSQQLSPEKKFQAGVKLLEQSAGSDWLKARDDYFQPLVQADPEKWEPRVADYLNQIEQFELKAGLTKTNRLRRNSNPQNEEERLIQLAQQYRNLGDFARAEGILSALCIILAEDPKREKYYQLASELLVEWQSEDSIHADRSKLLSSALKQADQLSRTDRVEDARKIYRSILELYASDPSARKFVIQAEAALQKETKPQP